MNTTTLFNAPVGQYMRIQEIQSEPAVCQRLRELGFCENALVRCMINTQGNLICEVCHSRIGITSKIAQDILVSPF